MSHFKEICSSCGDVISQCRCPGPKEISYGICEKCKTRGGMMDQEYVEVFHVCKDCDGTGVTDRPGPRVINAKTGEPVPEQPPPIPVRAKCPMCDGKGRVGKLIETEEFARKCRAFLS